MPAHASGIYHTGVSSETLAFSIRVFDACGI